MTHAANNDRHRQVRFKNRKIVRSIFYLLFFTSLMVTLIQLSPIRLIIPLGTSALRETDILMLLFVGLWGVTVCTRRHIQQASILYLLVLVLVLPLFIGLAVGKSFNVVLRDFRTPLFFFSILAMLDVLQTYADLQKLLRFMIAVGGASLLIGIGWWLIASRTENIAFGSYRFGISSALSLIVWLVFLALAYLALSPGSSSHRRWAWVLVISGIGFVFFANDIRSIYVAVLGGLAFLTFALSIEGKNWRVARRARLLVVVILYCCALLGVGLALAAVFGLDLQALVAQDMRLARLYSLASPFLEETDSFFVRTNVGHRMLGVLYGFELGIRNGGWGLGYGDNDFIDLDESTISFLVRQQNLEGNPGNTVENLLLVHNSYGWALGRLGLWLAISYFVLVLILFFQGWKAMRMTSALPMSVILLGTLSFVVYNLIVGFGGAAIFDYMGQDLITWLVCLAVLIRSTNLANKNRAIMSHRLRQ